MNICLEYSPRYFVCSNYERIILSDVLTNTRAAEIGTKTTITAKNILLKNALNDGVIFGLSLK